MKRSLLITAMAILAVTSVSLAEEGIADRSSLKLGVGGRSLAMGGAFVAVADDASAGYWNPAGLAELKGFHLLGGVIPDLHDLGIQHQFLNTSGTIGSIAVGGGLIRSAMTGIPLYDENGNMIGEGTYTESLFLGSVAMSFMRMVSVGANVKWYSQALAGESPNGFGLDVGLLIHLGGVFSIGLTAFDVGGTRLGWTTDAVDVFPPSLQAGAALSLFDKAMVIAADYGPDLENFTNNALHLGLELNPLKVIPDFPVQFVIRLGRIDDRETLGIGFRIWSLSFDIALLPGWLYPYERDGRIVISGGFSL